DHDPGVEGGGDQPVAAVAVVEHIDPVAHHSRRAPRDVAPGPEDLPLHPAIQIETEVRVLEHLECVHSSNQCHALARLADPVVPERPPVYRVALTRPITAGW